MLKTYAYVTYVLHNLRYAEGELHQLYTFVQRISMNLFSLCTGVFQQRASNLNEL